MLRKAVVQNGATKSARYDYDEKGAKISSQKMAQTKNTLLFLAVFCLIGMGALYTFQDSTDFHPFSEGYLRARGLRKKSDDKSLTMQYASDIPQNSIYHVSVKGADGGDISLEQYSGMVSLVVNTACK